MKPKDHVARIRAQFTRQADAYAETEQARDERALGALARLSGAGPDDRVLDVACGPGGLTLALAGLAREAVGCDVTDALLERGRYTASARGVGNVSFVWGDANALPFGDGEFDLATCRAAVHHFPQPQAVLAQMKRVVKSGGGLLIADMVSDEDPAKADYHNRIERLCDPTHVRALTRSEFAALFKAQGLTVAKAVSHEMHYDAEAWLDHGGPDAATRQQIVALLEASLETDRSGLKVRREGGTLQFTHQTAVFVLT
jgi:ubiquinone/menaquinone biosynthesis C-methylase UbiE